MWVCTRLHSGNSEPAMWFSQTTPDEHPPTPPPCRRPALITLRTLTKFQLVCRHLCDVVLFCSSCLFECTLTAVCALPGYRSGHKYNIHTYILSPYKRRSYFRPDSHRFEVTLELYEYDGANARLIVGLSLSPSHPPSPPPSR